MPLIATTLSSRFTFAALCLTLPLLSACGGGGGGKTAPTDAGQNELLIYGADLFFEPKNLANGERIAVRGYTDSDGVYHRPHRSSALWYAKLRDRDTQGDVEFSWTSNTLANKFSGQPCVYNSAESNCSASDQAVDVNTDKIDWNLQVSARDENGAVTQGGVEFYVDDLPPVAVIISPQADKYGQVTVGDQVIVDGRNSHDKQSGPLFSYHWELENKPDGSAATLTHEHQSLVSFNADLAGDYTVSLYVEDSLNQFSPVTRHVISAVNTQASTALLAEVEVSSPILSTALQKRSYDKHPYAVVSSDTLHIHEKVGNQITLNGINNNAVEVQWLYQILQQPNASESQLQCETDECRSAKRFMTLDQRGDYVLQAQVQQGENLSIAASIRITATDKDENAIPMIGDALVYTHQDACVSAELSAPWAVDADGPMNFAWRIVSKPVNTTNYVLMHRPNSARRTKRRHRGTYVEPDESLRSIMVSARGAGAYVVELFAKDRTHFSEAMYFVFNVSEDQVVPADCHRDSDNDGINDYHDPTPLPEPEPEPPAVYNGGSHGRSGSCSAGSACVSFHVNRAIYGF